VSSYCFYLLVFIQQTFNKQIGCCWAFGAASAASDRACIASNATIFAPFSAEDICFNSNSNGCNGGSVVTPWSYIFDTGVVTGTQNLEGDIYPLPYRVAVYIYCFITCAPLVSLPFLFLDNISNTHSISTFFSFLRHCCR
jgi:hypothetical protein